MKLGPAARALCRLSLLPEDWEYCVDFAEAPSRGFSLTCGATADLCGLGHIEFIPRRTVDVVIPHMHDIRLLY